MKLNRKVAVGVAGAVLATLGLSACGQAPWEKSIRDLEHVKVVDPDYALLYNDVDQYPNVVMLCLHGAGFAATTRPDFGSLQRVEAWDEFCATKVRP